MPRYMTIEQLSKTPEFRKLSPKQGLFLKTYIQSFLDLGEFDPKLATRSAYDTSQTEHARIFSYQLLKQKKVQAALRVWRNFGKSKRQIAIDDLETELNATPVGSAARRKLLALRAELLTPEFPRIHPESSAPNRKAFSPQALGILNAVAAESIEKSLLNLNDTCLEGLPKNGEPRLLG